MGSGQFAELLFIERFDPLVQGDKGATDVLLDRYIAYRAATSRVPQGVLGRLSLHQSRVGLRAQGRQVDCRPGPAA